MKKIYEIYAIIFISLFFNSCSQDFLERAPISQTNVLDFYKSEQDISLAVTAAYASLHLGGAYGSHLAVIPEMRSDNTQLSWMNGDPTRETIIRFELQTNNSAIESIWTSNYMVILRCNVVLDRIVPIEMDLTLKNRYIGEVKFIRALTYFNLVRLFGDIPLVLKEVRSVEEGYEHGRVSEDAVYEQIILDLIQAAEFLPIEYSGKDIGRVTRGAAKSLLGKVYLTIKEYNSARDVLFEVIDLGIYDLLPDYADLWDPKNKNNEESIFDIQYKKGGMGTGSSYANATAPKFSAPYTVSVGTAHGFMCPTQDMEDAYEEGDLRKDISMASGWIDGDGNFVPDKWTLKYRDEPFLPNDADNNWPVLRYADVLLMYAEVLNELGYEAEGMAFNFLNQVRSRAGLAPKTSNNADPNLRVSNQDEFRRTIELERRVELAFEGHRLFDLIRTDRFVEVMSQFYDVQEHQKLFPIPQSQIDINPDLIYQNPGYVQ